ncbi:thiol-disulfide oxidoreductase DCC family protein [Enterovibrio baiacu]|uniref:thiol-disulfide oxidoreductase DCC family protein n=1 Tax=Enterovibrio baiacu TaxID=2491023 RepID=UPI003D108B31
MTLTVFYDGSCPLCVAEMDQLRALNTQNHLRFEDVLAPDFQSRYPAIDPAAASNVLHGILSDTDQLNDTDGQLLLGLDVTYKAWSLVGKKRWIAVLRWPVIRWFADRAYLFFARNRYRISYLFTGKSRCEPCSKGTCDLPRSSSK